jgi:hypothetical protein
MLLGAGAGAGTTPVVPSPLTVINQLADNPDIYPFNTRVRLVDETEWIT